MDIEENFNLFALRMGLNLRKESAKVIISYFLATFICNSAITNLKFLKPRVTFFSERQQVRHIVFTHVHIHHSELFDTHSGTFIKIFFDCHFCAVFWLPPELCYPEVSPFFFLLLLNSFYLFSGLSSFGRCLFGDRSDG